MKLTISHRTTYTYSKPVWLERHVLRLRPRSDGIQRLHRFTLDVEPKPAMVSDALDAHGNAVTYVWFRGIADRLTVANTSEVETLRTNAFDYLLDLKAETLPLNADNLTSPPAVHPAQPAHDETIVQFARGIAEEAGGRTLDFLHALNTRIHGVFGKIIRENGVAWEPHVTLAR